MVHGDGAPGVDALAAARVAQAVAIAMNRAMDARDAAAGGAASGAGELPLRLGAPNAFGEEVVFGTAAAPDSDAAESGESASPEGDGGVDLPPGLRLTMSPSFQDMLQQLGAFHAGPAAPPPWANDEWRRLLDMSMADAGGMKRVASDEGLDEVTTSVYRAPPSSEGVEAVEEKCAITQTPFEDGDAVAQMPCGHKFDSDSLMHWLQRESAGCPVCRKEVASREVMRSPDERAASQESDGDAAEAAAAAVGDAMVADLLQPLLGGIRLRVQGRGIPLAQRRMGNVALLRAGEIEQESEDDQIEAAILAAVMRDSMGEL